MGTEVTTIPRIRKVYYATYANLPTTGLKAGDLGYATDRLILYRWSGAAWQEVTIHSSFGLAVAIPTAADLPNGSLYFETDTAILKQIQAGAWVAITQTIPSGMIIMWSGTIANIPSGWLICDGNNGTPNLLGRFVEGVATAATNPGASGGATSKTTSGHLHTGPSHTHTGPSHTHTGPSHQHDLPIAWQGSAFDDLYYDVEEFGTGANITASKKASGIADAKSYPAAKSKAEGTGATGADGTGATGAGGTQNTGSKTDSITDIRPKYYAIAFLMKI